MILKLLTSTVLIKVLVDNVKGSSSLVLESSIVFNFSLHVVDFNLVFMFHALKPLVFSGVSFFSLVSEFVLFSVKLCCTDFLISNSKVFIEAFTLYKINN